MTRQGHIRQNSCQGGGMRWLSGNIRRKLTLFVVVILLMIVGLFWLFSTKLLQPFYQQSITTDLKAVLDTVAGILNEVEASGEPVYVTAMKADGTAKTRLSDECITKLNAAIKSGKLNLNSRCLDIAGKDTRNLLLVDNLRPRCLLHPSYETGISLEGEVYVESELNGDYATLTRRAVMGGNDDYERVESGMFIMGTRAAGGQVSVIVSANLERIPQAVDVLKRLLLPLSMILVVLSTTAAWVFSRWFTQPINKLSAAAREMGRGNYAVRVEDCGDDEIGDLGREFNAMAGEVGRSAELQRDLMANVSHDLRTPLTLIKGYAETVRDLSGDDPVKRTEQLNVIVDESDRLSTLVGRVMELSRMSSGAERPEPVRFDLYDLGDELAYRYEEICRQQGGTFLFSGEEGCNVFADPGLIERALHNLLGNAMAHVGADGFVGLKVYKLAPPPAEKGDKGENPTMVRCEVTDHGEGIDEKDLPHIFERYYRSRADNGKPGTGLGLSITKVIFESQDIHYGVITEKGKGTTFWFETPLSTLPPPVQV